MKIAKIYDSPNKWGSRSGNKVYAIVIHFTGGGTKSDNFIATKNWFMNPRSKASSHYVVNRDGKIYRFVKDGQVSWHAGLVNKPTWKYIKKNINPNLYTIGIENVAYWGQKFTNKQYISLSNLIKDICKRHNIPINRNRIIGHEEIDSISRKGDPTACMNWKTLFKYINNKKPVKKKEQDKTSLCKSYIDEISRLQNVVKGLEKILLEQKSVISKKESDYTNLEKKYAKCHVELQELKNSYNSLDVEYNKIKNKLIAKKEEICDIQTNEDFKSKYIEFVDDLCHTLNLTGECRTAKAIIRTVKLMKLKKNNVFSLIISYILEWIRNLR